MTNEPTYWIRTQKDKTHYYYSCSRCRKSAKYNKYPFCPHCGRRMETDVVLNENGDVI